MPIKISDSLPARSVLESENIFVMTERRAISQDIRPLKVLILNLMPTKITTETQILRQLSNTPLQIEVELLKTASHISTHVDAGHLDSFYTTFDEVRNSYYDGMIITGAPVETLEYETVDYWDELCEIMEWTKTRVFSTLHICWGAQAGLYYHHGVKKRPLDKKIFGVFPHRALDAKDPLFRGFDDVFYVPHSRHTDVRAEDILKRDDLKLLSVSENAGVFIAKSADNRHIYVTGHLEYDAQTLADEYFRDVNKGLPIELPQNYFPGDDPGNRPIVNWRSCGQLMYTNWLNYYVYQTTPYEITKIGSV